MTGAIGAYSAAAAAQEVVQPMPTGEVNALNAALQRLAQNPQSVDALIDAGTAALQLGDIDAAIGFFGRADELSPGNPRAKLGMAAGFMRSERPIEALRLFSEAEKAGVSSDALAGDRALAFDLVGDNFHAQQEYRKAIARNASAELTRRLALSLAISGDRKGFEDTLLPLLRQRDLGAYRTRAFGLAILGDAQEAQRITDAVMPKAMASKLKPYLEYMPRLTKAQQAAAANFGRFPQASQIGRDDPQLAQYAREPEASQRQAGAALEPRGEPLGTKPAATGSASARVSPPQATPARVVSRPVTQDVPTTAAPPAAAQSNLDRVAAQQQSAAAQSPQSMDDAFSGFTLPTAAATSANSASAVDITAIKPPREIAPPPPPKHPERIWVQVATGRDLDALKFDWRRLSRNAPEVLGDFSPHTVKWGVANRLLAGPYRTEEAAREAINALKAKGIDTFGYTSPEGEAIAELK